MNLNNLINRSYDTLEDQAQNARLILLHPHSRYRSVLVAKLLGEQKKQVFYYAMGPDDIDLRSFVSGITHDLSNQHSTFGRHINILPPKAFEDFDLIVETFAQDLAEVGSEPFYLILDEYDRSDSADDIQRFVEKLVENNSHSCRVIINGRTLPRLPWVSLIAQKIAVLLEDENLIKHDFYNIETAGKHKLEVFALGPGQVLMDGKAGRDICLVCSSSSRLTARLSPDPRFVRLFGLS